MGEAVGDHPAGALALDAVIADGAGRVESFLEVTCLEHVALALGVIAPDPGQTIRLQLEPHRELVGLGLADPPLHGLDLGVDAQQVLDVVADLVGDHVGLGEIAGRAEALFELVVEAEVDIELVVGGAVEGAHCRAGHAAGRPDLARKDDQVGFFILAADRGKDRVPGVLGVGQHHRHEIHHLFLSGRWRAGVGRSRRAAVHGQLFDKLRRVAAEQEIENRNDQKPDTADTADGGPPAHRRPPPVFDVLAPPSAFPTHVPLLWMLMRTCYTSRPAGRPA